METLFNMPAPTPKHPAKYTDALLSVFVKMLKGYNKILDPFGGTGKVFLLNLWYPNAEIQAIEIEPEWAKINPRTTHGNALALPWKDNYFDAICTSPTYGNRMADVLLDGYDRITYTAKLGRKLDKDNSGSLQWGKTYRDFHERAYLEATRVLQVGGAFVLNMKNHIRAGEEQFVTAWHIRTLESLGYEVVENQEVRTPSMKFGQNSELRLEFENVVKLVLKAKTLSNTACTRLGGTVTKNSNGEQPPSG
jgi:tRNA G10  N-methylase Trm11